MSRITASTAWRRNCNRHCSHVFRFDDLESGWFQDGARQYPEVLVVVDHQHFYVQTSEGWGIENGFSETSWAMTALIGKARRTLSARLLLLFLPGATDKPCVWIGIEFRRQP